MPDPTAIPPMPQLPAGWTPTASTVYGGAAGGALAQVVIATIEAIVQHPLASATAGAITTLCIIASGYIFKDGGRK